MSDINVGFWVIVGVAGLMLAILGGLIIYGCCCAAEKMPLHDNTRPVYVIHLAPATAAQTQDMKNAVSTLTGPKRGEVMYL